MRRTLGILAALFLFCTLLVLSGHSQTARTRIFRSAEVVSASGVQIPFNSVANGIVELYLTIDDTGKLSGVRVARPLASVTEEAVRAVKSWTFAPATMQGKPVTSQLTVCVVFCPLAYSTPDLPLTPIDAESQHTVAGVAALPSISPEVTEARYPPDGNSRVIGGTVVLRVLVGADGQPGLVRVVKDAPTMTENARIAIAGWKFSPAQLDGKPAISGFVVAFAFRNPIVTTY
jgi:TonB family protein